MQRLSNLQGRHFRQNGYLLLREALPRRRALQLAAVSVDLLEGQPGRFENAHRELAVSPDDLSDLLDELAVLVGPDIVLLENRHNHVTVDHGSGLRSSRAHRDARGWTQTYLTLVILLAGTSSDAWTRVLPGSHLASTFEPHNGGGTWMDESSLAGLDEQLLPVEMQPGDALLLDPLTFHRAGRGSDLDPRIALSFAIRAPDELSNDPAAHETLLRGAREYHGQGNWLLNQQEGKSA